MTLSESEERRLLQDVEALRVFAFGNGNRERGADELIRQNTVAIAAIQASAAKTDSKIDGVKESVDALRDERRADNARREGAVSALGWLKYALGLLAAIVAIGGGLGYWQVSNQNKAVLEQIQRIPALPE